MPPLMADSIVPWALPLASNPVASPATAMGSSLESIDFDDLSKDVGLALPKAPLRRWASIPPPSRVQSPKLCAVQTTCTPTSVPSLRCKCSHSLCCLSQLPSVLWTLAQWLFEYIACRSMLQISHPCLPSVHLCAPILCTLEMCAGQNL